MILKQLYNKSIKIIRNPYEEWVFIKSNIPDASYVLKNHVFPLLLFICISSILSDIIFDEFFSIKYALINALLIFITYCFCIYTSYSIINKFFMVFESIEEKNKIIVLISYSLTPELIAEIFSKFHHSLAIIEFFGLYSVFLLWVGLNQLFKLLQEKKLIYLISTIILFSGSYYVINKTILQLMINYFYTL